MVSLRRAVAGLWLMAGGLRAAAAVDFATQVAPIFESKCVQCHHAGTGGKNLMELTSRKELMEHGLLEPGKPEKSMLFTSIENGSMPPGEKLTAEQIAIVRQWVAAGAPWPDVVTLKAEKEAPATPATSAGPANKAAETERIRERIVANHANPAGTKSYNVTIPNTTVSYAMTAIAGGKFRMGSSEKKDEGPPHEVQVDPFWMQTHEVTWDEYRLFMFASQANEAAHKDELVDAVSRPTRPYVEMSFGMGLNGFPAISMTQHAANKYAEWLSAKTGEFYRLPTEAEWEYACRAGSTEDYPYGKAGPQLNAHAWYAANSGGKYQKVGSKEPNAWGLFDMLGNVMEWTLDADEPYRAGAQTNPWVKPTHPYPIVARGGSWNDPAESLGCAVRVGSDPEWKQQDPQLPKSIWYETDAQWLGFRLVRPVKVPSAADMAAAWNNGVEHDEQ